MRINGNTYTAEVNSDSELLVSSTAVAPIASASADGDAYSIQVSDAGPVAAEYTLYFQNDNSSKKFYVTDIWTHNVTDTDVEWIIHKVTGTAAGASVITPANLNSESGKVADATCRGGAGGVTGLTSSVELLNYYQGLANTTKHIHLDGALVIPNGTAIGVEYQAGSGAAVRIMIHGYYK